MQYYRTKEDISKLATEFQSEFSHRSEITKFNLKKHNMLELLGSFTSVTKESVWLNNGNGGKDNQFKVSEDMMDYLVSSGIYRDAVQQHDAIKIFGYIRGGKIIDIVGLNLTNLIDPHDLKKL